MAVGIQKIIEELEREERNGKALIVVGLIICLCIALSIYPYVLTVQLCNVAMHRNQVVINQTTLENSYWKNGAYVLDFSVDVDFKKYEVSSFEIHTVVYKGDKYIGYIKTDFYGDVSKEGKGTSYRCYEKNTNRTLEYSLSCTQRDNNTFSKELCNGNPEDFTFVSNIIEISFVDETYVGYGRLHEYSYNENGEIQFSRK